MFPENLNSVARGAKDLEDALFDHGAEGLGMFAPKGAPEASGGAYVQSLEGDPATFVARQGANGPLAWVDDGYGHCAMLAPQAARLLLAALQARAEPS